MGSFPIPAAENECGTPLAQLAPDRLVTLLEAAAQFRLCRKAARLQREGALNDEALFQGIAEALGYRHNKQPFILLAQNFPLATLRALPSTEAESLLFGGAGWLSRSELIDFTRLPSDTRDYLRALWTAWWAQRDEWEPLTLPEGSWNCRGARPANHPQRRLAALAAIVRHWPAIRALTRSCDVRGIQGFFELLTHPYWDHHYTLTSQRSATRMALVGESRVTELLANLFFPAALSSEPRFWASYTDLAAPEPSERLTLAAQRLLGPAPGLRRLLKRVVYQQGLLQLFDDHCLPAAGRCTACGLCEKLASWRI
jgi:hypothetical protein